MVFALSRARATPLQSAGAQRATVCEKNNVKGSAVVYNMPPPVTPAHRNGRLLSREPARRWVFKTPITLTAVAGEKRRRV